jgi:hypothetical protein
MDQSLTNYWNTSIAGKSNKIDIPQGPQFKTRGGIVIAMVFLVFLLLSIVSLVQGEYLAAMICIILTVMLLYLVLDIRGILVDTGSHKIKDYKLFLWFKIGKWSNLKDFKAIYVTPKNVTVRSTGFVGDNAETFHYYHIKFVDESGHKEIFLAEFKNYYKAQRIAMSISNATGLEFRDFVKGPRKERK